MTEKNIQVFIDGVLHYFNQTSKSSAVVGTPYLLTNSNKLTFDYTGIIGISGAYKGCVYFTAPAALLRHLLLSLGETDTSTESLVDLVGEVANTISGNARKKFGSEFMISVPVVMEGSIDTIHLPRQARSYVIPITWHQYNAAIVVYLDR